MQRAQQVYKCYACTAKLTDLNRSNEHILPNGIGGRLKSPRLLCKTCNNKFGKKYEAEFVEQLRIFAARLPIKRQRGENRKLLTKDQNTGYDIVMDDKGNAALAHVEIEERPSKQNGGRLRMIAPDEEAARTVIDTYKAKFRDGVEFEEIKSSEMGDVRLSCQLGGKSFFKSAQKCFLNLFLHEGGERQCIEKEIHAVFDHSGKPRVSFYSDDQSFVLGTMLRHVIAVIGRPEESLLFGYAEFFSGIRVIGVLNDKYDGPAMCVTHAIDPIAGAVAQAKVHANLSRCDVLAIADGEKFDTSGFAAGFGAVESAIHRNHLIHDVVMRTLFRPENIGKTIAPEMIGEFSNEMTNAFLPYVLAAGEKRREKALAELAAAQKDEELSDAGEDE